MPNSPEGWQQRSRSAAEMGRDARGSASLAQTKWGDGGVPTGPQVRAGARLAPAPGCTLSIAKFHLPFSRTKLLI